MPSMSERITPQSARKYPDSWYAASAPLLAAFPRLEGDIETDICVIGGGYTGLSAALHLRKKGYDVVLLEAERVGWGASGRNGGHVGTGQRADQTSLEKWVGMEAASSLWQMSLDAVNLVCALIAEHNIDCELGSGNLHLAAKRSEVPALQEELEHLESVYGYDQLSYLSASAVSELTSAKGFHGALLDRGSTSASAQVCAGSRQSGRRSGGANIRGHSRTTAGRWRIGISNDKIRSSQSAAGGAGVQCLSRQVGAKARWQYHADQ